VGEFEKHVLEQAKIEVEHTRSWPTKILAFYVAINGAIVTAAFALAGRQTPVALPSSAKVVLAVAIFGMACWVLFLLGKNHRNYLRHRNLQVCYQIAHSEELVAPYEFPPGWLTLNKVSLVTRWPGWSFYAILVCLVAVLAIIAVCKG